MKKRPNPLRKKTKLFNQLKIGEFFEFPSEYYRKVIFMKTQTVDAFNSVWMNRRGAGAYCHFTSDCVVVPIYKKDIRF